MSDNPNDKKKKGPPAPPPKAERPGSQKDYRSSVSRKLKREWRAAKKNGATRKSLRAYAQDADLGAAWLHNKKLG